MIRGFGDLGKEEEKKKKGNDYYAGGEKSGLAVSSPDVEGIVNRAQQDTQQHGSQQNEDELRIRITLYANGFMVDDGPFRDYSGPENEQFMKEMNDGRVPSELLNKTRGKPVSVELADKRKENYEPPPPPKYVAFSGEGKSAGGPSSQALQPVNAESAEIRVDSSKPTTNVQIRFHNGQRKTITVNLDTQVAELYDYVMMAAPVDGSFELVSGFPPQPLNNPGQTVDEAGVSGSAVIQKLL